MLFQPSAQHTAALCLQRPSEDLTQEPSMRSSSSSSSSSSSASLDSSSSEEAHDLSSVHRIADDSKASQEAMEASSGASLSGNDLPASAEESVSTGSQEMHGCGADPGESTGSRDLDVSDAASIGSVDSTMSDCDSRSLDRRLVSWRVVPLVSERLIRTEDITILGVTASTTR